jgi:hypothetical protein
MSTVLTFTRPNGKWSYAVTPTKMSICFIEFDSEMAALDAAKKLVEREGWTPIGPPSTSVALE